MRGKEGGKAKAIELEQCFYNVEERWLLTLSYVNLPHPRVDLRTAVRGLGVLAAVLRRRIGRRRTPRLRTLVIVMLLRARWEILRRTRWAVAAGRRRRSGRVFAAARLRCMWSRASPGVGRDGRCRCTSAGGQPPEHAVVAVLQGRVLGYGSGLLVMMMVRVVVAATAADGSGSGSGRSSAVIFGRAVVLSGPLLLRLLLLVAGRQRVDELVRTHLSGVICGRAIIVSNIPRNFDELWP